MKKIILSLTVLGAVSLFAAVNTTACAGCHGANFEKHALGKSKIVKDMSKADVEKALLGYKAGTYGGAMKAVMKGQVAKYSDDDLKAVAQKIGK